MKRAVFVVTNMDCPTEEALIRKRLAALPGVVELGFDLTGRRLTVAHTLADEQPLVGALGEIGMIAGLVRGQSGADPAPAPPPGPGMGEGASCGAVAVARPSACTSCAADPTIAAPAQPWGRLAVAGVGAIGAEILAWTLGADTAQLVVALALASIGIAGLPTLRKGWIALKTFTLNIHFLMSLAVLGAVAIGKWPEAAVVIFLFALAEAIEALSLERARDAIRGLLAMAPETASVCGADGEWREVDAAAVQVGQLVRVRPGERIALDGVVTAGASAVNQAPITGESLPVDKVPGDPVFAATVNERGAFEFRVTAARGETTFAHIIRAVQQAQAERAPTQRFIDRFAGFYTPAVVLVAVLIATVPPLAWGAPFAEWFYTALVLLVIACPCALVISTPVTVVSGLAAAARHGILVKGGAHLENGRRIRAVALDKTGTLTHGRPVVTDVVPLVDRPAAELLQLAASVEAHSEHPVAEAIVAAWRAEARRPLLDVVAFEALAGRGAQAMIGDRPYLLGNHRLIAESGLGTPQVEAALGRLEGEGKTAIVLASGTAALAVIGVADTVRPHSAEAIRALRVLGVTATMLSGDNPTTVRAIADAVGIADARGNLLPEDKLAVIDTLAARHGTVAMVGDGINDAPALARASIGFAMGAAGTDTALETADVALMDDDLRKLPRFIALSRATARILAQNIALALGIKAVFFALALTGQATLWMAVFADMGASLIVVANGLRLLRE